MKFRNKLIVSFLVIFTLFSGGIAVYEKIDAKRRRADLLNERLDVYASMLSQQVGYRSWKEASKKMIPLFPENLRITIVAHTGELLFDNRISTIADNHFNRPEIIDALRNGSGWNIRRSASNNVSYIYYAKNNGEGVVVRVALPYDSSVRASLEPDNAFFYFLIALLVVGGALIYYVANHFGRSVRKLRDFSVMIKDDLEGNLRGDFPDDELGEIEQQLVDNIRSIRINELKINREREKLLLHIQSSAEGVCFFNADKRVAFYNGLFIQYYNVLSDKLLNIGDILEERESFVEAFKMVEQSGGADFHEYEIRSQGRCFMLRINVFDDNSFEFILSDITAKESTRRLKNEMTGNIAHELRTPVTSIKGFLEILKENGLSSERAGDYLQRAYLQSVRLSELISDMGILTKMVENRDSIVMDAINLSQIADKVKADLANGLDEKGIWFDVNVPKSLVVRGNESLLYSVLHNLTGNVLSHAGCDVKIDFRLIDIKNGLAFLSFADNGCGIFPEHHLNRIFDRFYRVGEGRTRSSGGSGLGLSIVKNAVLIHGGDIMVKNRKEGGLEFIFSLPVWER